MPYEKWSFLQDGAPDEPEHWFEDELPCNTGRSRDQKIEEYEMDTGLLIAQAKFHGRLWRFHELTSVRLNTEVNRYDPVEACEIVEGEFLIQITTRRVVKTTTDREGSVRDAWTNIGFLVRVCFLDDAIRREATIISGKSQAQLAYNFRNLNNVIAHCKKQLLIKTTKGKK